MPTFTAPDGTVFTDRAKFRKYTFEVGWWGSRVWFGDHRQGVHAANQRASRDAQTFYTFKNQCNKRLLKSPGDIQGCVPGAAPLVGSLPVRGLPPPPPPPAPTALRPACVASI